MTVRITNPRDWAQIKPGHTLPLGGERQRTVKIEFNTEAPTSVRMSYFDLEPDQDGNFAEHWCFIALIEGNEKVEVVADPGSEISVTSEGEVWFFTNDGQWTVSAEPRDDFVVLIGEPSESDHLRMMLEASQANFNLLRQQQEQERQERDNLAFRLAAIEAASRPSSAGTGSAPVSDQGQTQSASGDGSGVSA